jgi:hypothetical protein
MIEGDEITSNLCLTAFAIAMIMLTGTLSAELSDNENH